MDVRRFVRRHHPTVFLYALGTASFTAGLAQQVGRDVFAGELVLLGVSSFALGSWDVMDEEQRDSLIKDVIVPRWGATTRDGHVLKATLWAEILGTTEPTIRGRYQRVSRRSEAISEQPHAGPTEVLKSGIRTARSAIRRHPELAAELLKDPEIAATIRQEIVTQERRETHHERPIRPIRIRTLNDQWHDWLNAANTLFTNGARLATATDSEAVDLDAHAAAARVLYDRLVERQIDAEIRSFMDAKVR